MIEYQNILLDFSFLSHMDNHEDLVT